MVLAQIQKQSVKNVIKTTGFNGIYCGFWATLCRDIIFNMAFFTSRELLVNYSEEQQHQSPNAWTRLVLGYPAGCVAYILSCPLDVVKTRIQGEKLGEIIITSKVNYVEHIIIVTIYT